MSKLSFHSNWFGPLIKGSPRGAGPRRPDPVGRHGEAAITETDLRGMLRSKGTRDFEQLEIAHLERSGEVSFIMRDAAPQVVDVSVERGVQTISIRIS